MDGEGARPDALDEARRKHKPKTVYLVPTQQNPTTATMSPPRRKAVADVLRKRGIVLIEDDVYGPLEPSLFADSQSNPRSDVLRGQHRQEHRAGAARRLFPCAQLRSRAEDAGGSTGQDADACSLMVAPLTHRLRSGIANEIIRAIRNEAVGQQQLAARFPKGISFAARPASHYLWLPLPERLAEVDLRPRLARSGLVVVGEDAFATEDGAPRGLRVSLERRETAPN